MATWVMDVSTEPSSGRTTELGMALDSIPGLHFVTLPVNGRLCWYLRAVLPPRAIMTSGPELLPMAVSQFLALCSQSLCWCPRLHDVPGSWLSPKAKWASEDVATARIIQILVACLATRCHCDVQTWDEVEGHVWVHGPMTPGSVLMSLAPGIIVGHANDRVLSLHHDHIGVRRSYWHWGSANLSGLCCHLGPWWHLYIELLA